LGQVTLLLHSLARKIKLEFKRFKLVPYGNYSFIQALENVSFSHLNVKKDEKLHMYGVGGFKYYLEWDKKFDTGMVAFLDCLQQLEEKIKTIDASFSFPYPINGYKLEDKKTTSTYSIKCHFNSYEEWTKALKYMLTNLKWSLAWVVSQSQP
jgi:beclin 1